MLLSPWGRSLWVLSRSTKFHFSAGGSWCDLAHLLWAALLQWGFRYGPSVFRGCCPHHVAGPLWVSRRLANLHFSAGSSWHDLAHLLWAALLQGGFRYGPSVFRGYCSHHVAGPLRVLSRSAKLHFSASGSWCDLAHLLWAVLLQWGFRYGRYVFRGCCSHHGAVPLWVLSRNYKIKSSCHITTNHIPLLNSPLLTFQGSGALANIRGVATSMLGMIFTRLTGDLSQTKEHLSWRWQVDINIPCEAALPRVNVPNHVRSHRLKKFGPW